MVSALVQKNALPNSMMRICDQKSVIINSAMRMSSKNYLKNEGDDPNSVEYGVGEDSLEHVSLTMNFPRVDLVK
jgi:hypothetical protein